MADVSYRQATCVYAGSDEPAVDRLDLDIEDGEFMVLVGPSGSGKSTALRMLAGLEDVTSGQIRIGDEDVSQHSPRDRDIAMVFQSYALYPHMTVSENMSFALRLRKMPKDSRRAKVLEVARMLDLEPLLDRKPRALSGGQRQRVAMGRAIVREPAVFLMDEPLSNLDAKLRVETRANIAALQSRLGTTTVYVTHDQIEAMTMGDRVAVLRNGVLQQVGTPRDLYDRPDNEFVATFIGSPAMNLRTVQVHERGAQLGDTVLPLPREALSRAGQTRRLTLGVRPESFEVAPGSADGLKFEVTLVEELGSDAYVYGRLAGDEPDERPLVIRTNGRDTPHVGETLTLAVRLGEQHLFDPDSGRRLG